MSKINGILMLLIYICFVTALLNDVFVGSNNLGNVVKRSALFGIISIGVAFVIITGGIDLSIGSLIGLVGCVMAILLSVEYESLDESTIQRVDAGSPTVRVESNGARYGPGHLVVIYDGKATNQGVYRISSVEGRNSQSESNSTEPKSVDLSLDEALPEDDQQGKIARVYSITATEPNESRLILDELPVDLRAKDRLLLFEQGFERGRQVSIREVVSSGDSFSIVLDELPDGEYDGGHFNVIKRHANSVPLAIGIVMLMSLAIGLIHGLLITKVKLQPFVVTLCGLLIYRGIARTITSDQSVGFKSEYDETLRMVALGTPCSVATLLLMIGVAVAAVSAIGVVHQQIRGPSESDSGGAGDERRVRMYRFVILIVIGGLLAVIGSSRFWFGMELDADMAERDPISVLGIDIHLFPYTVPERGALLPMQLMSGLGWLFIPAALGFLGLAIKNDRQRMIRPLVTLAVTAAILGIGLWGRTFLQPTNDGFSWLKFLRILIVFGSVGPIFGALAYLGREGLGSGGRFARPLALLTAGLVILWLAGQTELALTMVPAPFFVFVFVALVAALFMTQTIYGRYLLALGRNEQAARFSGIKTDRMVILSYVICSGCAGLGGVLFALDLNSIQPAQHGNFYELYAIAAAVLGGCSLRGGEGTILGVVIGAAVIRVLRNSIFLIGIPDQLEFAIIGAVILVGVIVDEMVRRFGVRQRARDESTPDADSTVQQE